MKLLRGQPFDAWRRSDEYVLRIFGSIGDDTCGVFLLPGDLLVIASAGNGWDHVSVSRKDRCPTWDEMSFVKRTFFEPHEWAMELHPPESENVNLHQYCLHLWRPNDGRVVPIPPREAV